MDTLKMFISDLHSVNQTVETTKFLNIFDKLNSSKIVKRIYDFLLPLKTDILNKNIEIFDHDQFILPEINLSIFWEKLDETKKNNMWIYLQMLLLTSSSVCDTKNFNPYIGVEGGNVSIDSLCREMAKNPTFEGFENGPNMNSLFKIILTQIGVKNPDEFVNNFLTELKNIKPENVKKATDELNNFMGIEGSENKEFLSKIINALPQELNKVDLEKESFNGIIKIAQNIMENVIKPEIQNGKVNVSELMKIENNLMNKINNDVKMDPEKSKETNDMVKKMMSMFSPDMFPEGMPQEFPNQIPDDLIKTVEKMEKNEKSIETKKKRRRHHKK